LKMSLARFTARRDLWLRAHCQFRTRHCILAKSISAKKQGAAGITTAAPHIAGQWGRGDNRLPE
jgi:hypothetical protein